THPSTSQTAGADGIDSCCCCSCATILHHRRRQALAGAPLVVTRWAGRMRGTSCPWEAHRGKFSKSRSTG
ncbi:hypothetical protein BC827DRAFT_1252579, partial [Russula dissimulans]